MPARMQKGQVMTDMREAVARAICQSTEADVFDELPEGSIYRAVYMQQADAALSIVQPEIDRRVAEERAKLFEQLREPSEGTERAGLDAYHTGKHVVGIWRAMLTQFEKENSHEQG